MTQQVSAGPPDGRQQGDEEGDAGLNAWYIDDMQQAYLSNPGSVDAEWRAYFSDEAPIAHKNARTEALSGEAIVQVVVENQSSTPPPELPPAPTTPLPASLSPQKSSPPTLGGETPTALRGVAARIVENMVASTSVPTATSVHPIPAKILEVNRNAINEHLAKTGRKKVSFTHFIAYAIAEAIKMVPSLNATFVPSIDEKGTPGVIRHHHLGLGLAVDLERPDGSRALVVPVIKLADTLDFYGLFLAYEELIAKARSGKLQVDDFAGASITITNPGTLGTTQSIPRLMVGQGAIVGVGALGFPAEYQATDPETLAALGVGKVVTLTSTYDHRIIQGAESGLFLKHVHELLVGESGFYERIFAALGVPGGPAHWHSDRSALVEGATDASLDKQLRVHDLIDAYRAKGHLLADIDPLSLAPLQRQSELELESFGLTAWDLERAFATDGLDIGEKATLRAIVEFLRTKYCATVGAEYQQVTSEGERRFLQQNLESKTVPFEASEQRYILERLSAAEGFEQFLHLRYVGQRRFGLEGAESVIPFLDAVLEQAVDADFAEAVVGMAHRGRLNVLANVIGKPYSEIIGDFEGHFDPEFYPGAGDVKYHKGAHGRWTGRDGRSLPISLVPNPSHLEAVDPVVEGIVRAKQDKLGDPEDYPVLAILIHGDAAFSGQGVVAETLNMSLVPAYRTGGTIHLVINNQVGFTTQPGDGRSTRYATDVAKMISAPVFHVNGDDPEAVVRVARLAALWRQNFHQDVVVDLVCYRLHGHNEGDDPSYTQPEMYKAIDAHPRVRNLYADKLISAGVLTEQDAEEPLVTYIAQLQVALDEVRAQPTEPLKAIPERRYSKAGRLAFGTGVDRSILDTLALEVHSVPTDFVVHPKLERQFVQRAELYASGESDWTLAESLAFGSLLLEGTDIRLTGQDTRRGTFSQRHAVLFDNATGQAHTPLDSLGDSVRAQSASKSGSEIGRIYLADSVLSEYSALGFEYGYSTEASDMLVMWEAQFGDFANGAQVIIDNFLVAAQQKWGQLSGLVLLLPHGYEGQGAEHSSARVERFLTLAAADNMTIVQPTTAAQYFHLLRAQVHRVERRPLVVMTPKSLLRARQARSPIGALTEGGFTEVIDDPGAGALFDRSSVRRVICCSGKIAYDAMAHRDLLGRQIDPVAVVRVEQLFPWPEEQLAAVLERYSRATELVWLQDEPENMGAWDFVDGRLLRAYKDRYDIIAVTRAASGTPATGLHDVHDLELEDLLDRSVGGTSTVA